MTINLTLTAESKEELTSMLQMLSDASSSVFGDKPRELPRFPEAFVPADKPAPVQAKPAPAQPEAPHEVTLEEVRKALTNVRSLRGTDTVKELLASFGVPKLSDLPAEKYSEMMKKVGAIA